MKGIDFVEGVSLVLTSPTMWMGVGVVCLWREQAWKSLRSKRNEREAHDWLILGVCVGFLGSVFDNAYWGIAWTLSYAEVEPWRTYLFDWGAFPNIFFRQIAGVVAAHCHITSFLVRLQNQFYISVYRSMVALSIIFGFIWILVITLIGY